jgi:autotransporter-associated beta strand protein
MKRVLVSFLAALAATLPSRAVTTLTWSGASGGGFTTSTNWVGGVAPNSADTVQFTATVTTTTVSFTGPGTTLVGPIVFNGASRPSYSFGGTGSPTLGLNGSVTIATVGDVTFASTLAVSLANNSAHTEFDVVSGATLTISGTISGAVGIIKRGGGTLVLTGTNTYTDKTFIKGGTLSVSNLSNYGVAGALGSPTNQSDGYIRIGENTITGTLRYTGPTATTNRGIDMTGSTGGAIIEAAGSGALTLADVLVNGAGAKSLSLTGTNTGLNTISGAIPDSVDGDTSVIKSGAGTWRLSGTNTYSGGTTISDGRLVANSNSALGTGSVTLSGGTLNVASTRTISNTLTFTSTGNASVLAGNGTFSSAVNATTNSVLAPGDSIGTLSFSNGLTLASGSAISFELQDAAGVKGTGYDLISISGGNLNLTASTNTITFNVITLNADGNRGSALNFNPASSYSWTFAQIAPANSAGSISNFNANQFNLVTTDFANGIAGGSFSFSQSGQSLLLNFTPVPEPSTYLLMGTGLSLIAGAAWRRKRR